ncbi:MAG TPA: LuxR C-terminal-related transcriptional regulator [Candidatus Rubrimentiphilum sp.]|nr:LuxR C-terminal-related transcriptional regulator [Candidatus Rubrimentiphilum sp.]
MREGVMSVYEQLPAQQARVVDLLLEGLSTKEIAKRMRLSQYTVRNYLGVIFLRYGVKSRSELIARELSARI